jgi:hypothetical protein
MDFRTAARGLGVYLGEHPKVSLDSVLSGQFENAVLYPAGAVLAAMAFEHGGVGAVKALFTAGSTPIELRSSLERELGRPWSGIVLEWRRRAMAFAKRTKSRARAAGASHHPVEFFVSERDSIRVVIGRNPFGMLGPVSATGHRLTARLVNGAVAIDAR